MQHNPLVKKVSEKKAAAEAGNVRAKRSAQRDAEIDRQPWIEAPSREDETLVELRGFV